MLLTYHDRKNNGSHNRNENVIEYGEPRSTASFMRVAIALKIERLGNRIAKHIKVFDNSLERFAFSRHIYFQKKF